MSTKPAPLEPLQEAILSQLGDIEGPNANVTRRLVYDIALIAYELGWSVAQVRHLTQRLDVMSCTCPDHARDHA